MKWLKENGFGHDTQIFHHAIINGDKDNIKWLYENGFKYDESYIFYIKTLFN
jgi:hypothetical protein